jgi:hypothetical protein
LTGRAGGWAFAGDLVDVTPKAIHARAPVILKASDIEIKQICPRTLFLTIPLDQGQQAKRYENSILVADLLAL